jgi:hypothetical protein
MKKIMILLAALASRPLAARAGAAPAAVPSFRSPQAVSLPAMPLGPSAAVILPSQRLPVLSTEIKLPHAIHPLAVGGARFGVMMAVAAPAPAPAEPRNDRLRKLYDGSERQPVSRPAPRQRERGYYPLPESDLLDEIGIK